VAADLHRSFHCPAKLAAVAASPLTPVSVTPASASENNLILSILHSRVAQGDPGRYWIALHGEKLVGVVVQSPLEYPATLTPMGRRTVLAMVDSIAPWTQGLRGEPASDEHQ